MNAENRSSLVFASFALDPSFFILPPSSFILSLALLAAAAALMLWHTLAWRRFRQTSADGRNLNFRHRQFRRRMYTSATFAAIALLLPLGEFLVPRVHSRTFGLLYWAGVLLGLFYICLMAVLDMLATKFHYSRLQQDCRVQQARLQSELKRIQRKEGNGRG